MKIKQLGMLLFCLILPMLFVRNFLLWKSLSHNKSSGDNDKRNQQSSTDSTGRDIVSWKSLSHYKSSGGNDKRNQQSSTNSTGRGIVLWNSSSHKKSSGGNDKRDQQSSTNRTGLQHEHFFLLNDSSSHNKSRGSNNKSNQQSSSNSTELKYDNFFLLDDFLDLAGQQNNISFSYDRGIIYNLVLTKDKDLENVMNGRLEDVKLLGTLLDALRVGKEPLAKAKAADKEIKVALFADPPVITALEHCAAVQKREGQACSENATDWAQQIIAGVDRLIPYDNTDVPSKLPLSRGSSFKGNRAYRYKNVPLLWWKRIWALKHSPWERTLALDLDTFLCDPFLKVFELLEASPENPVHVVDSIARLPYGGSCYDEKENVLIPQDRMPMYKRFPERNCGAVAVDSTSPAVQKLLNLYEYIFIEEMRAPISKCFRGDQTAWREALFLMTVVEQEIRERVATSEQLCRVWRKCNTGCWTSH